MREKALQDLVDRLDVSCFFPDEWVKAVTHSSYANEHKCESNERLEFVGDGLLDAAMALVLARTYPKANEGDLTKMRSALVNNHMLAQVAADIGLEACIRLGKGEVTANGSYKISVLSGAMEAVCAVIYDEDGFDELCRVVKSIFSKYLSNVLKILDTFDPKGELQQHTQKVDKSNPAYNTQPGAGYGFRCEVAYGGVTGRGTGGTKLDAEKEAAQNLLRLLKRKDTNGY
jgi:ribonuclease-3